MSNHQTRIAIFIFLQNLHALIMNLLLFLHFHFHHPLLFLLFLHLLLLLLLLHLLHILLLLTPAQLEYNEKMYRICTKIWCKGKTKFILQPTSTKFCTWFIRWWRLTSQCEYSILCFFSIFYGLLALLSSSSSFSPWCCCCCCCCCWCCCCCYSCYSVAF